VQDYLISIIIPAYNVEAYVARALESCISQTYNNLDICVIDDGSKDGTADVVRKYMERDARIRMVQKPNGGLAAARNTGFDNMNGDFVLFLDADDWFEPDAIEHYVSLLDEVTNKTSISEFSDEAKTIVKDGTVDPHMFLYAASMYGVVVHDDGREERKPYKNSADKCVLSSEEALLKMDAATMNLQSSCYKMYSVKVIKENNLRFIETMRYGEDSPFVFDYLKKVQGLSYSPKQTWNRLYRAGSLSQSLYSHNKICNILAVVHMIEAEGNSDRLRKGLLQSLVKRFSAVMTVALESGAYKNKADIKEMRGIMKPYANEYLAGDYGSKHKLFFRIYQSFPICVARLAEIYTTTKNGKDKLNSDIGVD